MIRITFYSDCLCPNGRRELSINYYFFAINMLGAVFLIAAPSALLWIGTKVQPKTRERERMSAEDAKAFPLFGSAALLFLFCCLKYLSKDILNTVFRVFFSFAGVVSVYRTLLILYHDVFKGKESIKEASATKDKHKTEKEAEVNEKTKTKEPKAEKEVEKVSFFQGAAQGTRKLLLELSEEVCSFPNLISLSISVSINSLYLKNKTPALANIIASAFCISGLRDIRPDSTRTVLLLLGLLFVYDVFWVFCTPVMLEVAKGLDIPIKLVYTQASGMGSMIGLGDIVVPGFYLGVAREFAEKNSAPWVFYSGFLFYILSLLVTFLVVLFFKKGQPALLYICPLIVLGSFLGAFRYGKLKEFIKYTEEAEPEAVSEKEE